jgi:hypothetical protein
MMAVAAMVIVTLNAADVAGTWTGSMDTQAGMVTMTITLRPGATLAGTVKADQFGEAPIEKAKLDGEKISFEINIDFGKVTYEGTVAGDEMKLTLTGPSGNQYPLNCKRQK